MERKHLTVTDWIAILTVVCCFGYFFWVSFSPHARTQDSVVISIATALVAILPQVLSFYFGQAKKQPDHQIQPPIAPKEPVDDPFRPAALDEAEKKP